MRPALTVEECIDATLEAAVTFFCSPESYERYAPWGEVYGMQERRLDFIDEAAEHHMVEAAHFRGHGNLVRVRYHLFQWRVLREARRAIQAERGAVGR